MFQAFSSQSANASSDSIPCSGGLMKATIVFNAGTGTVTIETSPNPTAASPTWVTIGDYGELSVTGQVVFPTAVGERVRMTLSNASGADVDGWLGGCDPVLTR